MDSFEESGYHRIVILEAFEKNYQFLKEKFEAKNPYTYRVIWGKVQEIENIEVGSVDVVFSGTAQNTYSNMKYLLH